MRTIFKVLGWVSVILGLASSAQAKDWRGIVPMRSSRVDVVRLHGQCANPELRCQFGSEDGEVYIIFSSRDEYVDDCVKQLPLGVVMHIQVTPKTGLRLSDLEVDMKRFRKFESSSPPGIGYEGYLDEEEGIIYDTYKGGIVQIEYIADKKDKRLCPTYYEKPEMFVSKIVDPPFLYVDCPAGVEAGGRATLSVSVSGGDPNVTPTFDWNVSPGKIVSGQSTSSIVIEVQEPNARPIKATVEVGGYEPTLAESCEIRMIRKIEGKKRAHP
jgi:hypothetical protein